MNISLPEALKTFVDEQVSQGGYGTTSEYVRELIRHDQDRVRLATCCSKALHRLRPSPWTRPTSQPCASASVDAPASDDQARHPARAGEAGRARHAGAARAARRLIASSGTTSWVPLSGVESRFRALP
jgi:putative addiction module CopG family antidote